MNGVDSHHRTAYRVELHIDVLPWPERFEGIGLRRLSQLLSPGAIRGLTLAPDVRSVIIHADTEATDSVQAMAQVVRVAEVTINEIDPQITATIDEAVVTRLASGDVRPMSTVADEPRLESAP